MLSTNPFQRDFETSFMGFSSGVDTYEDQTNYYYEIVMPGVDKEMIVCVCGFLTDD